MFMLNNLDSLTKNQKILILGMGREGKSTHEFLKKFYPDIEVSTSDQTDGKDYLNDLYNFDLVIKSPGISWNIPKIKQ